MYDPPQLLKNVRSNLKKSGFIVNNTEVKWCYIEQLYEDDKKNPVRMAPKQLLK